MGRTLHEPCADWRRWSEGAVKRESDWPSEYPHFGPLIGAAKDAMLRPEPTEQEVTDIAFCWMLAEESEVMAVSEYADARRQAYTVIVHAGLCAEPTLRRGLLDTDPYSRRWAYLSLAELRPPDAAELAIFLSRDADPYNRLAAFVMARATGDRAFVQRLQATLSDDPNPLVRAKASKDTT